MKPSQSIDQIIETELRAVADPVKAPLYQRYFKTGPGQYGEGDHFLGVTVPKQRLIARHYWRQASLANLDKLLNSKWHEARLTAGFVLVAKYKKATKKEKSEIVQFYLNHLERFNNWDLVDSTAAAILGDWLIGKDCQPLWQLARSGHLWRERVSLIASMALIKTDQFSESLKLVSHFLSHPHDLIHKASGWVLREIGKYDKQILIQYLDQYGPRLPRTSLRYAIEHLSPKERSHYLSLKREKY